MLSGAQARPGEQLIAAVVLDVEPPYHINADEEQLAPVPEGESFRPYPTTLKVTSLPEGWRAGAVQYPEPHPLKVEFADFTLAVWEGRVVAYVPLEVSREVSPGQYPLAVSVRYQACDPKVCLMPQTLELTATLRVVPADAIEAGGEVGDSALFEAFDFTGFAVMAEEGEGEEGGAPGATPAEAGSAGGTVDFYGYTIDPSSPLQFGVLLLLAGVGGLVLNFTPCVLPVIPIKVLSLAAAAGHDRRRATLLGGLMMLGVAAFWLVIGLAIALLTGFHSANELIGSGWFSIVLGLFLAAMAAGMMGAFAFQLPRAVYALDPGRDSLAGSFGFGILAAILATPCTGPVLGSVASVAVVQPPLVIIPTFAAIGVGMGLPYFLLSLFPGLIDRIPRTGPGSELLKGVMGVLILAAAVFFVGVGINSLLADADGAPVAWYWWAVAAVLAGAGGWLVVGTGRITDRPGPVAASVVVALLLIGGAWPWPSTRRGPERSSGSTTPPSGTPHYGRRAR